MFVDDRFFARPRLFITTAPGVNFVRAAVELDLVLRALLASPGSGRSRLDLVRVPNRDVVRRPWALRALTGVVESGVVAVLFIR